MLPSCGCSQSSLVVGIGPIFKRSMFVASVSSHDGNKWEHEFFFHRGDRGGFAVNDGWPQIGAAFHFDQPRPVLGGNMFHASLA